MELTLLVVEDNPKLRPALVAGLDAIENVTVCHACDRGEEAIEQCDANRPDAILMDVQLAGTLNGIEAAVAIRQEHPRMPVLFYSIQDDDSYYRAFRQSGILSHYGYVRKSNYLLPKMIVPLLRDAIEGRSFVDPDIEVRVHEVSHRDDHNPLDLLEPNELAVAHLLAKGWTNAQIAKQRGFRDKRTISRTNGQIYAAWGLDINATDAKIARTRAALIIHTGRLIAWDEDGTARVQNPQGDWVAWDEW